MIIRVSELESAGLSVEDASRFTTAFADPAWRLETVSLHLTPDGKDVLVEGEIRASVLQDCSRCLESFRAAVRARVDVRVTPLPPSGSESLELGVDDLDTDFYANDELDLASLVATETTLGLPMKPLCRPDCRGLCPVCGGNRNAHPCDCQERQPDARLGVLKQLTARPKA